MTTLTPPSSWLRVKSIWPTSLVFSFLLLAGYGVLERPGFLLLIAGVGLVHLLVCMRFAPRPSASLLVSQSLVAIATVAAVVIHVVDAVGPPPSGVWRTVASFAIAELKAPSTYLYFGVYLLFFLLALAGLLLLARVIKLRSSVTPELVLSTALATSAVSLAFDYSLNRPLYRVSGEPGAEAFFFAAGLFGLEFSLPLFLILLITCWAMSAVAATSPDTAAFYQR